MALPTNGRVIIETTAGEIDIELWSKETPKTCRNFLALAMEGYYDGVIFHRIVPGFLVQTGDKTGTGAGGESFYGEPFEDEIHPRLRFAHRGLVAMANNGTKHSNDSQFIITLDRADELHGKHTLFGRCVGDTIYNVMKIGEMEIDANERPVYPPKIKRVRIIDNPFPDIIPRITAAEKRAQMRAREEAQKAREEEMRRRGAKKNVKLLSFGEDEGGDADEEIIVKKKAIVRPDLIDTPQPEIPIPSLPVSIKRDVPTTAAPPVPVSADTDASEKKKKKSKKEKANENDITQIRTQHARERDAESTSREAEIARVEAEIRKLSQRGEDSDEEAARKKKKAGPSALQQEMARYVKGRGLYKRGKAEGRRKGEEDVLARLGRFTGMLRANDEEGKDADGDAPMQTEDGEKDVPGENAEGGEGEEPLEVDTDSGFLSHVLHFPEDDGGETRRAERDYEVIDPRARGARAREEERERKNREKRQRRR